jgi:hypothetical protein
LKTIYLRFGTLKYIVTKSGELTLTVESLLPEAVDRVIVLTVKKMD